MPVSFLRKLFGSVSVGDLAWAEPRLEVQIALAGLHSAAWFVAIQYVVPPLAKRMISGLKNKAQFLSMFRDSLKNMIQYDMGPDPVKQLEETSLFEGVLVQHGVGGALCLPSVLGLSSRLPSGLTGALARHGALCEVGWEVSDTLTRISQMLFGGEAGRAKNPVAVLVMLLMHHSCAQCMVMPLNLYYPDNVYYHEGIFLLQGCSIGAMALQQYGYTLDIKTPEGLTKMKIATAASLGLMTWGRLVRYGFVWWKLITTFKEDQNTFVLKLALPPVVLLSLFNVALLGDCLEKFLKFRNKTIKKDSPEDIQEAAVDALGAGRSLRTHKSFFGLSKSKKDWAKIRGAVHMGAFKKRSSD